MNRANPAIKYQNTFALHFWVWLWFPFGPFFLLIQAICLLFDFFSLFFLFFVKPLQPTHSTTPDKQQEVDVDNNPPAPSTSGNPSRTRSPRTMSQISGFKRPLMHTNSFTSDKLPVYGVETTHEPALGAMLNDINVWGIDIFKIGTLSCNRPLTSVAYQIFQVRETPAMKLLFTQIHTTLKMDNT